MYYNSSSLKIRNWGMRNIFLGKMYHTGLILIQLETWNMFNFIRQIFSTRIWCKFEHHSSQYGVHYTPYSYTR